MRSSIVPRVNAETAGYWNFCRQNVLSAQKCGSCGRLRFPPQPMCPSCRSLERSWTPISGEGTVYTFSVVTGAGTEPLLPGVHGLPYAVAVIELDEGIRMVTDFDTEDLGHLKVGARVRAVFERVNDDIAAPRFELSG
jgi:uncharacterized OB-fold protein